MNPIRVVLADDSIVVRRIMVDVFARAEGFELVATASDGREAVAAVDEHRPDVVVLDIEMPDMDGIEALQAIRERHAKLPVVMFSTVARHGAAATLEALALGASDYVTKPSNLKGVRDTIESMEQELLPRLSVLARRPSLLGSMPPPSLVEEGRLQAPGEVDVVLIGASTGGPVAVTRLVRELPEDFPVPVVVVQHMPPLFTKHFAEQLGARVSLPVREVVGGERLNLRGIWIGQGGQHVEIGGAPERPRLRLTDGEPVNFCKPSVDVLFRSAAARCGSKVMAVVLTGMGQDGLEGARRIHAAGGSVLVQSEDSAVVWGMPGCVARAGLADFSGDPEALGRRVAMVRKSAVALKSG